MTPEELLDASARLASVGDRWQAFLRKPLGSPVTAPRWFVAYTAPKAEERAVGGLKSLGYAVFMPTETRWHRIPDRRRVKNGPSKVKVTRPLFPRYVFVGLDPACHSILPARSTDGVSGIVSIEGRPLEVSPALMARMMAAAEASDHDRTAAEADALARLLGREISIPDGLFAGFLATVLRIGRKTVEVEVQSAGGTGPSGRRFRLTMGVEMIQREAA